MFGKTTEEKEAEKKRKKHQRFLSSIKKKQEKIKKIEEEILKMGKLALKDGKLQKIDGEENQTQPQPEWGRMPEAQDAQQQVPFEEPQPIQEQMRPQMPQPEMQQQMPPPQMQQQVPPPQMQQQIPPPQMQQQVPPQMQQPQIPAMVSVSLVMVGGSNMTIRVPGQQFSQFVEELNGAIENQSIFQLGRQSINGRHILMYNIEK